MSYTLRAVLADGAVFDPPPPWIADSRVVPVGGGIHMIPLTSGICAAYAEPDRPLAWESWSLFIYLPRRLVPALRELSARGAVAYVEADYHGGGGEQRSVVWRDWKTVQKPEESYGAINDALRRLGVERDGERDAFDVLGLGRHRSNDEWLQADPSS